MFSVQLRRKGDEVTQNMSGPRGCTETSVRNYHYTVRNMLEDRRSQVDTTTMVTLKLHSTKTFPFLKATRQAPYIFMQSVCPLPSPFITTDGFCTLPECHIFECRLNAVRFSLHQSAITT
jgi:hypothetical protein